jgi:AbrB family looped-hinge helix DNA binding protein
MKAIIDDAGRLVLPPEAREAAGLVPGAEVEISIRDGTLEIAPLTVPVRFERKGHIVVAVPMVPVPPITTEMVNQLLDDMRREREGLA